MSSPICISDDDDSFDAMPPQTPEMVKEKQDACITISDDDSDEYTPPSRNLDAKEKRREVVTKLFPKCASTAPDLSKQDVEMRAGHRKIIESVEIYLPVEPYSCQLLVMSKVISAIKKRQNCLVESPTGTGKTLALLCAALAWQKKEQDRLATIQADQFAESHPELKETDGALDYVKTPVKKNISSPEKFFLQRNHGEKSIYDEPVQNPTTPTKSEKRHLNRSSDEPSENSYVTIHKKIRRGSNASLTSDESLPTSQDTPDQLKDYETDIEEAVTPEKQRQFYNLLENARCRTSMVVGCSLPVIYYGARTHKQLQQVVKEFRRTVYCGDALMTILSSRSNSCIREYDSHQWPSKNDMCRNCTKTFQAKDTPGTSFETNCKYYDNRKALNHKLLPPAFDLNDLIEAGEVNSACPYYAAREMARAANIIFCPYNYLVDPGIRNSLQINLEDQIVIIDEGHNIEDICRDTASFNFTKDDVQMAIKELESVSALRFANHQVMTHIEYLLMYLKNWEQWFDNQIPLLNNQATSNNVSTKTWEIEHFLETLTNHNIGGSQYNEFSRNVSEFCKKLREDPRTLLGVTQSTGTLLESLETVLGFLFKNSGKYMNDFKPVLEGKVSFTHDVRSWRTSQYNKSVKTEGLTLRLICLNPAVIFEGLRTARSIILASGTLSPILTLKSELGAEFLQTAIPRKHVVPENRVWVGSLRAGPDGTELRCTSDALRAPAVQDALGRALRAVCARAPHGVLCFLPSYAQVDALTARWHKIGVWRQLEELKDVVVESKNAKDHDKIMERYYERAESARGALLLAVYRGKAAEGMDFRDRQARAVVAVGVPYPYRGDIAVKEKINYNNKYSIKKKLLVGDEWYHMQAYRALNQAIGRCVRHKDDWGAVLLVDSRFKEERFKEHLSTWVKTCLEGNHHSFESLEGPNGLKQFLDRMSLEDNPSS